MRTYCMLGNHWITNKQIPGRILHCSCVAATPSPCPG